MSEGNPNAGTAPNLPAATPPPNAAPPATEAPKGPASLYDGVSEELKVWAQSKGYKGELSESGKILASLQEHDRYRGKSVVIPGDAATPEERAAFFAKMGRPEKPEGYKFESLKAPEGVDLNADPTVKWFREKAHAIGLNEAQASTLATEFFALGAQTSESEKAAQQDRIASEETALRAKWGANAAQNERAVLALVKSAGLEQSDIASIVSAWGVEKWATFASGLGSRLMEADHGYEDSSAGTRGTFAMAPESARVEIENLRKGQGELAEKYKRGDAGAVRRVAELHRIAYGA